MTHSYADGRRRGIVIGILLGAAVALIVATTVKAATSRRATEGTTASAAGGSSALQLLLGTPPAGLAQHGEHRLKVEAMGANPIPGAPSVGGVPLHPVVLPSVAAIPVVLLPTVPRETLSGIASWYCLPGRSRCTHGYPDGLYAAIRRDLLEHRGDRARVCAGERCVTVTIVDCNCSPTANLVDLYSTAFARLAPLGTGRIAVTLEWL